MPDQQDGVLAFDGTQTTTGASLLGQSGEEFVSRAATFARVVDDNKAYGFGDGGDKFSQQLWGIAPVLQVCGDIAEAFVKAMHAAAGRVDDATKMLLGADQNAVDTTGGKR